MDFEVVVVILKKVVIRKREGGENRKVEKNEGSLITKEYKKIFLYLKI